jgi:hypothetical protein
MALMIKKDHKELRVSKVLEARSRNCIIYVKEPDASTNAAKRGML